MDSQINSFSQLSQNKRTHRVIIFFIIIILLLLTINILFLGKFFSNQPGWISQPKSQEKKIPIKTITSISHPNTPPYVSATKLSLDNCDIKKEKNPLVNYIFSSNNYAFIAFRGNINSVNYNLGEKYASFDLISPKGEQYASFSAKDEKGMVQDSVHKREVPLKSLKPGQTIVVSFECFPKDTSSSHVTHIDISSNI